MLSRRQLRIKAIKALYAHLKSDSDNMIASEKNMMNSIDKTYDLYFQMMTLPVELAHYAQQRQELAKQKKLPTYEDLHPNTRFIDNAVLTGVERVTIIHGKGTGALRAAIQQHLRRHPSVKEFRLGSYGEGETGVTIAELK